MLKRVMAAAAAALFLVGARAQDKPAERPDPKAIEAIYACMAPGLPAGWKTAWVSVKLLSVTTKARKFEAELLYATSAEDAKGTRIPKLACEPADVAEKVQELNRYLAPEHRNWRLARLEFTRAGEDVSYKLTYDYPGEDKPKEAVPAAK
ncbi:MAG: hypothetical protein M0015_11450 [Betaproteobacteria bacterium]|nr:hypothetical protein [Betaproteobacteria bacterium]